VVFGVAAATGPSPAEGLAQAGPKKILQEPTMTILSSIAMGALVSLIALGGALAQGTTPEARMKEKNITLPTAAPPAAAGNRVGAVRVGNLLFVAGHPSQSAKGKVGKELTVEQGQQAARQSGLNLLATVRAVLGNLDHVKRVVKVVGFVNTAEGFGDSPRVVDGFSNLMIEIFGDAGKHARSAIGVQSLPGNDAVEVEAIMEVD
jgi:enamine deaminase RidA (YjgF/YER057c/UK114 family)